MNRYSNKYLMYVFISLIVLQWGGTKVLAEPEKGMNRATHIVWAQPSDTEYAIYYSSQVTGDWSGPLKLSNNEKLNVTPAITTHPSGEVWVVWSALEETQISLYYKRFHDNRWGPETLINTGLASNTAPTLLIDETDVVWLVWSGNNGANDEIFFSRWIEGEFEKPIQITENSVPDILPVLRLDDTSRMPVINWLQACDSGNCAYYSQWTGFEWSEPSPGMADEEGATGNIATSTVQKKQFQIPGFVKTPQSVSVHTGGSGIQSLPLRLIPGNNN
jgi:hypothetical protein